MKNYQFVVGLLLLNLHGLGAQAASVTPNADANGAATSPSGGSLVALQDTHSPQFAVPAASRFSAARTNTMAEMPIDNFLSVVNLSTAFHYVDGEGDAVRGLQVQSKLAQRSADAADVTEPASEVLLLAGLSALAIAIRRQSPS
jgi:hypothetical protein